MSALILYSNVGGTLNPNSVVRENKFTFLLKGLRSVISCSVSSTWAELLLPSIKKVGLLQPLFQQAYHLYHC